MLTVHLRVTDEATNRPTPVRLSVTGPGGAYYPPLGRQAVFPVGRGEDVGGQLRLGRENWAYIDGACELPLPAGVPLRIRAAKGPEYEPLDREVTLGPGQMALRFTTRRWADLTGWHVGDTRVHFAPPHAAALDAAAEGVAVANLLALPVPVLAKDGETYLSAPNLTAFSGQTPAVEAHGSLVAVNTFNCHPVLGSVGLLNAHRPVFPLAFGGVEPDDWSVTDWCRQCRRKKGLAVWADAFRGDTDGEAVAAAVLGELDVIEYDPGPRPTPFVPLWYRLLNAGVRLPLAGGSAKDSNRVPVGACRTYAHLGDGVPLTYPGWIEAVRAGRTFVTTGPLLRFTLAGRGPGETVEATGDALTLTASAESLTPFEKLELVADGAVIASVATKPGERWAAELAVPFPATASGWVAARCVGGAGAFAHTSPIWVNVPGKPAGRSDADLAPLRGRLGRAREWAETHARFTEAKWKTQLLARLDAATARLV